MKLALLSSCGTNFSCSRSIPVSSSKRTHDKQQSANLKPELANGEIVNSISLCNTPRIDLTSALINSFAAASLVATPIANASTMETIMEMPASLYTLADGSTGDWLSGLLYSASQQANVAVQDQLSAFSFTSLAVIFGAGLVTSLSPCTLSVLPLTLGYIGAFGSGKSRTEVIGNSISFAMGLATTLALLGVAASFAGKAYGQIGQGLPVAASSLAIIMGLNLLEVVELQLPSYSTILILVQLLLVFLQVISYFFIWPFTQKIRVSWLIYAPKKTAKHVLHMTCRCTSILGWTYICISCITMQYSSACYVAWVCRLDQGSTGRW